VIDHEDARLSLADLLLPGLADPTRSAAIRAHVAVCDDCRAELAELRRVDELLRASGPLPEPSAALEQRIRAIAGGEPQEQPLAAATPARPPEVAQRPIEKRSRSGVSVLWRSVGAWRVAAVAAAAVAVGVVLATRAGGGFSQQQSIALQAAPAWAAQGVRGDAQLGRQSGREVVRVRVSGLRQLADDGYYELWIARNPQDRVSLGAVQVSANGTLETTLPLPSLESGYKGVWLTAEPDDHTPAWSRNWVFKARFA
jgi:anti-sigma-K factor RskA